MSQENVELARRYVEAFNRGGIDAVEPFWPEDVEMADPEGVPDFDRYVARP